MGKKVGPNYEDVNRIHEWAAEGKTAEEISDLLGIEVGAVENNMPDDPDPVEEDEDEEEEEEDEE